MKSMTGYGRDEQLLENLQIKVEISSVNRKQLDQRTNLPPNILFLEMDIKNLVKKFVSRGVVNTRIEFSEDKTSNASLINEKVFDKYLKNIQNLEKKHGLKSTDLTSAILRQPGVISDGIEQLAESKLKKIVLLCVKNALINHQKSREIEGVKLQKDLLVRNKFLIKTMKDIKRFTEKSQKNIPERFKKRLQDAGFSIEDDSVKKEIILLADKMDVTEELVRQNAHLERMNTLLKSTTPVGRELDFLIQEILREINTVSSKSSDLNISQNVVSFKTEVERCREQVQNIE